MEDVSQATRDVFGRSAIPDRCLSVCEPWAWAIVAGFKPIENRSWATSFRGRIAIHASTSTRHYTEENDSFLCSIEPVLNVLNSKAAVAETHEAFNFGAIVGTVDVAGCIDLATADINGHDEFVAYCRRHFGDWHDRNLKAHGIEPEVWAGDEVLWLLDNALQFARPIAAKGALNLWPLVNRKDDLLAVVEREIRYSLANPVCGHLVASEHIVTAESVSRKGKRSQ